jgi:hypothetical protein
MEINLKKLIYNIIAFCIAGVIIYVPLLNYLNSSYSITYQQGVLWGIISGLLFTICMECFVQNR